MTTDPKLIKKYDKVYKDGEEKFWTFLPIEERLAVLRKIDFTGKRVLEIGCGTGDFAAWMATAGAEFVLGVDASIKAVEKAIQKYNIKNLSFILSNLEAGTCTNKFDVIVMIGVLEHVDNPELFLKQASKALKTGGEMIVTCPYFNNIRGHLWMAFKMLFDAPMSLTDKWEITPTMMRKIINKDPAIMRLKLHDTETVDFNWGNDEKFIDDFRRRLPKVFPEIDKDKIQKCMDYFEDNFEYVGEGANIIYYLRKA
jgi:2-polyprenyl-3-methyl-5-hydroxy-6-metoxy-1,4-benzoquinol methylase